jgi:hypothetical protein
MHIERVAVNHLARHRAGLLCTVGIQFDPVPKGVFVGCDLGEGASIPDARIQRGK